jgi:DNA-directed RNA polymerase specialized sigma24 family protein
MNDAMHEVETMGRLDGAMTRLEPQFRRLAELWLEGRTRQEIAMEMQLREEAVSTKLDAAIKTLRQLLSP